MSATWNDLLVQTASWREVTRDSEKVKQTHTKDELYGTYETVTPEGLAQKIKESGFEEYSVEVQTKDDYDGTSAGLFIEGWREATRWEIDHALEAETRMQGYRADAEAKQIAELKRTRPELFR